LTPAGTDLGLSPPPGGREDGEGDTEPPAPYLVTTQAGYFTAVLLPVTIRITSLSLYSAASRRLLAGSRRTFALTGRHPPKWVRLYLRAKGTPCPWPSLATHKSRGLGTCAEMQDLTRKPFLRSDLLGLSRPDLLSGPHFISLGRRNALSHHLPASLRLFVKEPHTARCLHLPRRGIHDALFYRTCWPAKTSCERVRQLSSLSPSYYLSKGHKLRHHVFIVRRLHTAPSRLIERGFSGLLIALYPFISHHNLKTAKKKGHNTKKASHRRTGNVLVNFPLSPHPASRNHNPKRKKQVEK
jgi:hypothetical protein